MELINVTYTSSDFTISKPELLSILLFVPGPRGVNGEPIIGTTRLTKLMFLLIKETDVKNYLTDSLTFRPYKYGPFSAEIYDILDALISYNIIKMDRASNQNENDEYVEDEKYDSNTIFKLTEIGIQRASEIVDLMPISLYNQITSIKRIQLNKPLIKLLHYVYSKYPEYAYNSEVKF